MRKSLEEILRINDKVHANLDKVLQACEDLREEGKWTYSVLHSDGTALGSYKVQNPPCHIHLCHLTNRTYSKCIREGISVPVVINQRVPDAPLFDYEDGKGEDRRMYWVQYILQRSLYSDMFLIKDVDTTLRHGFIIRTDVHAEHLLRTCSMLRKVEEHPKGTIALVRNAGTEVPDDFSFIIGTMISGSYISDPAHGHRWTGIDMPLRFKDAKAFVEEYVRFVKNSVRASIGKEGSFMQELGERVGWAGGLSKHFARFFALTNEENEIPSKLIPEENLGLTVRRTVTNSNVHTVLQNIYEELS